MEIRKFRKRGFSGSLDTAVSEREKKHTEIIRRAASQGMILLENDGVLPVRPGSSVALYGGGAIYTIKGGTGSGSVNNRTNVSILDGFINAGYKITDMDWLEDYRSRYESAEKDWKKLVYDDSEPTFFSLYRSYSVHRMQMPKGDTIVKTEADTAFYVISRVSGEGADRQEAPGNYYFSDQEKEEMTAISSLYPNLVVILNIGGVMDLKFLDTIHVSAVILMSQAGMEGGNSLADVVSGRVNPSGRLTDTWPENYSDYPSADTFSYKNGNLVQEYYNDGIYVGYRYFDSFGVKPRYSFGYGLSYTSFSYTAKMNDITDENASVTVTVTNTGKSAGREIVFVFASCPSGLRNKEHKRLTAFAKTGMLEPGQSQELALRFPLRLLESYHTGKSVWYLDGGDYILFAGFSSDDTQACGVLRLSDMKVMEQLEPVCELLDSLKEIKPSDELEEKWAAERKAMAENLPVVYIDKTCEDIANTLAKAESSIDPGADAEIEEEITEIMSKMTTLQKAQIVCGQPSSGSSEFIGAAAVHVPGAAGETSGSLKNLGIGELILSDGPAGLRILQKYEENPEDHSIYRMTSYQSLQNRFFGDEFPHEGSVKHYQFASAIPIGTLLAQSFDTELLEEIGELIGREMKEFGVTLWLAPGMNIHRNALCGRNFEYYSEDPLVAGKISAAITRGVQSLGGIGTTIKHYAANNQEENRMNVSSVVSERALREIYLRGFEICVREAQPMAVMTSYNRVNSVHTANSYDLCTTCARKEWGFKGIFVSDWTTTNQGHGSSAVKCVKAGNDLIMPGNQSDIVEILNALESKDDLSLTMEELDICVRRMLRTILKSDIY